MKSLLNSLNKSLPSIMGSKNQTMIDAAVLLKASITDQINGGGPKGWVWQETVSDSFVALDLHHPQRGKIRVFSASEACWDWRQYLGRGYNMGTVKLPNGGNEPVGQYRNFKTGFRNIVQIAKIRWGSITVADEKRKVNDLKGKFHWG